MRMSEDRALTAAIFAGDVNGGMLIKCSSCHWNTFDNTKPGEPLICLAGDCRKELFYRPWYEW